MGKLLEAQSAAVMEATPTLHVTTQIVSLDVAVLDKKGHPSSSILGRDDFVVTEDGKPQQLLFFEPPSLREKATTHVFVLDSLNTDPADTGYYLVCLERYLKAMPEELPSDAELMVLSSTSLRIVQPPTRKRAELLSALAHMPASGVTPSNLEPDRFRLTLGALESVALEHLGDPGRTDIVWLGPGDGIEFSSQMPSMRTETQRFVRALTNTFLEGRTTLYVIFPPGVAGEPAARAGSGGLWSSDASTADPYRGAINFRTLAAQTGGAVFSATNDLAAAMRKAVDPEKSFYSLGYRPAVMITDGQFRQIRVTPRDPGLHVVTKSGYYAPETGEQAGSQDLQVFQMTEAGKSALPFHNLELRITHIDRSADGKEAEFTILAEGKHLHWSREGPDGSLAELTVGGLGLSDRGEVLSSHFRNVNMMAHSQDPDVLSTTTSSFKLTLGIPSGTNHVRLIVSLRSGGRLGCVDAPRSGIIAAATSSLRSGS